MSIDASAEPLQPIRLMRNASVYHRMLRHRFAVPRRIVNPAIRGLKHIWNPSEKAKRIELARQIGAGSENDHKLAEDGYVVFGREVFPELQSALEKHKAEIETLVQEAENQALQEAANKRMLTSVAANNDLFDMPELMSFAVSRPIVEMTTRYFGRVPLLTGCTIWWSPPNETIQQSQLFHCDGEDARQLKFMFFISEVTPEHGPFTLLPGGPSDQIKRVKRIVANKVEDSVIEAAGELENCLSLTGQSGDGACIDTCRCLHYGSRGNTKPRIVLMLRFNDHLAPNVDVPDWHLRAGELDGGLDDMQKLVLGIESA